MVNLRLVLTSFKVHVPDLGNGHHRRKWQQLGAVLGAFITWFAWIEAEPVALWAVENFNSLLSEENPLRQHFIDVAPHEDGCDGINFDFGA